MLYNLSYRPANDENKIYCAMCCTSSKHQLRTDYRVCTWCARQHALLHSLIPFSFLFICFILLSIELELPASTGLWCAVLLPFFAPFFMFNFVCCCFHYYHSRISPAHAMRNKTTKRNIIIIIIERKGTEHSAQHTIWRCTVCVCTRDHSCLRL